MALSGSARAGQVLGWGDNTARQRNFPTNGPYEAIAAGGFQSLLSQPDGSILISPANTLITPATNGQSVVALAAGYSHGLVLLSDGTVFSFGNNDHGQVTPPGGFTNFIAVGAGAYHSLGVLSNGTVLSWGDNYQNHRAVPVGLSNVVAVAGGYYHSLALRSDGTVAAWGLNGDGQVAVPAGLSNVAAIAAGSFHSLALRKDGTVVAWGRNDHGQSAVPDTARNVVAIAAGYQHSLALKSDGTVQGWGDNHSGQSTPPPGLTNAVALAAGYQHSIALLGAPRWPVFQESPASIFTNIGASVTFTSLATGAGPVQYQWQFNGQDLPGQTDQNLQLSNVQAGDAGRYTVITGANGFFISARAALALETPAILDPPSSQTVLAGQDAFFRVGAVSLLPLSYQWQFHGLSLLGATNDSLLLPAVTTAYGGLWQVVVTTGSGSITSAPALLTVLSPPAILANPANTVPALGDTAQFFVSASGSAPLSYQWFFNGLPVPQATNSTFSLRATLPGQTYVIVGNPYGSSTSAVARLDITLVGKVLVWGDNSYSESNAPPGLTGLSQLACGAFRVMALKTNGTLVGWGRNVFGEAPFRPT